MKIFIVIIILSLQCNHLYSQVRRTVYNYFNTDGDNDSRIVELSENNKTTYTSYSAKSQSICRISIREEKERNSFKRVIYDYSYIEDSAQLKSAKNFNAFVKKNAPERLRFKIRETWTFYIKNDSLFRFDLSEYDPVFMGSPRATQVCYVTYDSNRIVMSHNFLEQTEIENYAKDSIISSGNGRDFKRYYLRWDPPSIYKTECNDSTCVYSNDSLRYSEICYLYDNEPYWRRIFLMNGSEGAIYRFRAIELKDKVYKWKYDYRRKCRYDNKFEFDDNGRITKIILSKDNVLRQTLLIDYQ